MINFTTFINEAKENVPAQSPRNLAKDFVNMYNRINKATYVYVDDMKFKNKYGDMTGSLFISGTSGMRVNFRQGKLWSISTWKSFGIGKTPTNELIFTNEIIKDRKNLTGVVPLVQTTIYGKVTISPTDPIVLPKHEVVYSITDAVYKLVKIYDMTDAADVYNYIHKFDKHTALGYIRYAVKKVLKEIEKPVKVIKSELADEVGDTYPRETEQIDNPEAVAGTITTKGTPEKVEQDESVKLSEEELANQLIADPLPVFEKLNSYVVMVARGFSQALLITGQGGVGKSYNVNRILNAFGKKNKDYVILKGKSTVSAMYKFLYENYNKICVFDDCDSVLEDSDGLNILKGALDSGEVREISWNSKGSDIVNTFGCETHDEVEERLAEWSAQHKGKEGTPSYFQFQGACIFISNKSVEEITKNDAALLTRCTNVDINLMAKDVILRMQSVLPSIKIYKTNGQDITDESLKQEVFEYISSDTFLKDPRMRGKQISFRLFHNCYKNRAAGLPAWKELAFGCC